MTTESNHLDIWRRVDTTPTDAVKAAKVDGQDISSIDQVYVFRLATEIFGPMGIGWGFDIVEERFDQGEPIQDPKTSEVIAHKLTHTVRILLWYRWNGEKGQVTQFGHTPYLYRTRAGGWKTDTEAPKKSVSDAIKKCLSLLGFCADVFAGKFDNQDYVALRNAETRIAKAEDAEAELERYQQEYADWVKRECETLEFKIPHPKSIVAAAERILARTPDKASVARVDPTKGQQMIAAARDRGVERVLAEREKKAEEVAQ